MSKSSARAFRPSGGFRVTLGWVDSNTAKDAQFAPVTRPLLVREAYEEAKSAQHPEWFQDLIDFIMAKVPPEDRVAFACRCARQVQHLWPEDAKGVCDNLLSLTERWLIGDTSISDQDLDEAHAKAWHAATETSHYSCYGAEFCAVLSAIWAGRSSTYPKWTIINARAAARYSLEAVNSKGGYRVVSSITDDLQRLAEHFLYSSKEVGEHGV